MAIKKLIISYGGTLRQWENQNQNWKVKLSQWIWTYRVNNIDQTTRSPRHLIKAIKYLIEHHHVKSSQIQVHFWGNISKEIKTEIKQNKLSDFFLIEGYKSKKDTLELLTKSDLLFLPLESKKNNQKPLFIPGKLFEYLSLRKKILLLAGESDCAEIAEKSGLGVRFDPHNYKGLSAFLNGLIQGESHDVEPNEEFIKSYHFKEKTRELASVFTNVLN